MLLASHLVQGVDVWINNPRRPWEASGTSGMKVLVNGGLNLSELDGWWAEAYAPEVGWALGDGQEHGDDPAWDAAEAEALFTLLEQEVIPAFYSRDANGIPTAWVARMRESMAQLTARFDANRTVREYTEQFYLPAAAAYRQRAADKGRLGAHILDWQRAVAQHWGAVRFGDAAGGDRGGSARVPAPGLSRRARPGRRPGRAVRRPRERGAPLRQVMTRGDRAHGRHNGYTFTRLRAGVAPGHRVHAPAHPAPSRGRGPAGGRADSLAAVSTRDGAPQVVHDLRPVGELTNERRSRARNRPDAAPCTPQATGP